MALSCRRCNAIIQRLGKVMYDLCIGVAPYAIGSYLEHHDEPTAQYSIDST